MSRRPAASYPGPYIPPTPLIPNPRRKGLERPQKANFLTPNAALPSSVHLLRGCIDSFMTSRSLKFLEWVAVTATVSSVSFIHASIILRSTQGTVLLRNFITQKVTLNRRTVLHRNSALGYDFSFFLLSFSTLVIIEDLALFLLRNASTTKLRENKRRQRIRQ